MVPSNNDGYLHTLPTQERHVYAEIDERMVSKYPVLLSSIVSEKLNMRYC